MRVYLAGPMRGQSLFGFQAFEDTANHLRRTRGWDVVSPHDIDLLNHTVDVVCRIDGTDDGYRRIFESVTLKPDWSEAKTLETDTYALLGCDALVLMDGWQTSKGACYERTVAEHCGKRVFELDEQLRPVEMSCQM